jgi:hypothetical protein
MCPPPMRNPIRKLVALPLCCQPVFWMSYMALAQNLQQAMDLQVEPGSALVVPERNVSGAEVVGIGLSVGSILVAIATLYVKG